MSRFYFKLGLHPVDNAQDMGREQGRTLGEQRRVLGQRGGARGEVLDQGCGWAPKVEVELGPKDYHSRGY